ncbi:NADH-quinone oxidoreductase subunit N [Dysgonomonas sp. 520]|uniref:NADH-quinone oxidoreductase subunit N n=1 Tax=Dysgonomonas sp. 520 TaxID=2302931 RepID=UPI0013D3BD02|nr:NADH-quinone oxidoreductase subunit N [Dysgonomonas sp. 520]NDW08926.1 NADH-quinone oxidoreductase subunit N [Dysgonomonas sp. 520]
MITLVAVSGLGILCLILEIINLRKILVPVTLLGLVAILGATATEFYLNEPFIEIDNYNMVETSRFSQAFSILFILLTALIIGMSSKFYEDKMTKIADYVSLKIFMLAGAIAMVSFGNFAMFFIGIEVLSICGYVLAASEPKNLKSNEAGMKYFIMGAFASSFILFGLALLYGATGSFDVETIKQILAVRGESLPVWANLGFVMVLVGLLFKASVVPFHFWAPDVYEGSPTLVTTIMSTLIKVAAISALFKFLTIMSVLVTPTVQLGLIVFSIITMLVANITALRQSNLKRMMAYSGISHTGFMMMGLLSFNESANSTLYYAAAYSFAAIAGFAVIMAVCQDKGNENISNIFGLARRHPALAGIMACAMVSLGGIPVFAGFFAKMFVFSQMFEARQIILVMFGIVSSIIAIFYYFGTTNVMFTKENPEDISFKASKRYTTVAFIAISLNILIGVCPFIIMDLQL